MPCFMGGDFTPTETIIRVTTICNGESMESYIDKYIIFRDLCDDVRALHQLGANQVITMRWVTSTGELRPLGCQHNLDAVVTLYKIIGETELVVHVFPNEQAVSRCRHCAAALAP